MTYRVAENCNIWSSKARAMMVVVLALLLLFGAVCRGEAADNSAEFSVLQKFLKKEFKINVMRVKSGNEMTCKVELPEKTLDITDKLMKFLLLKKWKTHLYLGRGKAGEAQMAGMVLKWFQFGNGAGNLTLKFKG